MVYIEKIILVDLFIHFVILYLSSYLCKKKLSKIRLIYSCILNISLIIIYIYITKNTKLILCLSIIIALLIFLTTNIKSMLKETIIYLSLNFLLGGIVEIIYIGSIISNWLLILIAFLFFIIIVLLNEFYNLRFSLNYLYYKIIIINDHKKIELDAYLDTGNFLESKDFLPIIVLSKRYKIGKFIKEEDCFSITGEKKIKLYKVQKILISSKTGFKEVNAYLTYSNLKEDAMIGLKVIGG